MTKNVPGVVLDFIDTLDVFLLIPRPEAFEIFTEIMSKSLPYDISPVIQLEESLWDIIDIRIRNPKQNKTIKNNLIMYVSDAAELFGDYDNFDVISKGVFEEYQIRIVYDNNGNR